MTTMKAVQYRTIGGRPEVVEIEKPTPGPGEILLKVTAAGLCHSDEFIMSLPEDQYPFTIPQTLGHEPAGLVAELGEGVTGVEVGDAVIVYGCWGCGVCAQCADGWENLCLNGMTSPGLGRPGAMAEYMIVDDVRHLVPTGDLDPVKAASLTDAALTPYQAIKPTLPKLTGGSTAVVIGAGGLGHVAIQLLKQLSAARVIALDLGEDKLEFAKKVGADEAFESGPEGAAKIRELTKARGGADVVLDFVGADVTGDLAVSVIGPRGDIVIVGAGGGGAKNTYGIGVPLNVSISTNNWGRRAELAEVVEMARRGQINIETTTFGIDDAPTAYEQLHAGTALGRLVVTP